MFLVAQASRLCRPPGEQPAPSLPAPKGPRSVATGEAAQPRNPWKPGPPNPLAPKGRRVGYPAPMHPDAFTRLRPYAYHLTARANLPAIERTRRLDPSSAIFARANRQDLLRTRRRGMTTIGRSALRADSPSSEDTDKIIIRDQDPLHAGSCALTDGYSFEDLVEMLNSFVYFWPGTADGPNAYGRRHFARYAKIEDAAVLRIPTASLLAANPTLTPHASAYNSGSPRCSGGRKSPRGPDTFQPFSAFPHTPGKVVELSFAAPVNLPWLAVEVSTPHNWI